MKEFLEFLIIAIGGGLTELIFFIAYKIYLIPPNEWRRKRAIK